MNRNVLSLILLLFPLVFSLSSCGLFQPVSSAGERPVGPEPEILFEPEVERPVVQPKAEPPAEPKTEPITEVKTEVAKEDALRQNVVDYARQFVGTSYKTAGKNPGGFDCSGFTGYVMGQFGIQLSASSKYQEKDGEMIPVSEAKPGDLIFFRREKNGTVFHVSLVVSNDENGLVVVHSTSSRGVVVDNIDQSSYWREKYATACRVIRP
ncbi:MAG: DUF1175 family protein [Lewinellaceae bacterium]|nr:DUF1175 family protein [Lewinellaceae bacterium]